MALVLTVGLALLTSCGSGSKTVPVQPVGTLQITTSQTLIPAFDPNISDYVFAYKAGSPVQVTAAAPQNTTISVDGQPFRGATTTTPVNVTPGQSFSVVVNTAGTSKTYNVRCLPTDFPTWTTERTGTPQAEYYIIAPSRSLSPGAISNYVVLADSYGVPIWWYRASELPLDAKLLPNGNMAWTLSITGEEHKLDGSLVRTFTGNNILGGTVDGHELLLLPNGNYLYITNQQRVQIDLSFIGGSASAMVIDNIIDESAPDGTLVWHWSSLDHIPVSETDPLWRPQFIVKESPADPYHMNSIEPDGDGYIISQRHLNAVLRIDKASGNITWKLGGSQRPESLTFTGDTFGNFGGQHDARILPDGTLTLHDNGSLLGRAPRAVRYRLDPVARTATLIEQVTDAASPSSICCGNSRKLPEGNWVAAWGANFYVTELDPAGKRVFRINFPPPVFTYRVEPVRFGTISRAALRKGMDTQFPR